MNPIVIVLVCGCLAAQAALGAVLPDSPPATEKVDDDLYKLPKGFLMGAGLSATQSEGATSEGGKSESAMDRVIHQNPTDYKETNDQAADHYHRYKEDLGLAKQLKFTSHRFSISWARVFPTGDISKPNKVGVDFYHDYIDEIKKNGMEPLVTMYHFDHPYSLEVSTKGWTSDEMVTKFIEYADFIFNEYGSKVKYWNPINEGNMYCIYLPGQLKIANLSDVDPDLTFYQCEHNMVRAHAKTYRLYKEKYFEKQQGHVGTSVLIWPTTPVSTKFEDIQAAEMFNQLFAGIMIHPLIYGDYPPAARYFIDKRSFGELGLKESRLPHFSDEDKKMLQEGPATDFVALNVYSGFQVEYNTGAKSIPVPLLYPVNLDAPFLTFVSGGRFDKVDPDLMKTAALWAWNNYHLPLIITENGYGDSKAAAVHDSARSAYMSASLRSLIATVNKYEIPLISFHAWSLLDLYEFQSGYSRPFGLIHVDYKGKTLKRTLKDSSTFFIEMADTGRVPYVPDPTDGTSTTPKPSGSRGLGVAPAVFLATLLALVLH